MSVSGKIRAYLKENGMVQKTVARQANIPYPKFNAMMTGRKKMYVEDLCAICNALRVKPDIFMDTL